MTRKTMVIAIAILIAFCAGIYFWAEKQKRAFDASLPKVPVQEQATQVSEQETGGHWHGDEWHADDAHQPADAVLGEGIHFADLRETVDAPATESGESQASPAYVPPAGLSREQNVQILSAERKWRQEVWEPARDEYLRLLEQSTDTFSFHDEELMKKIATFSDAERAKFAAEAQADTEKIEAAWEKLQAVEREMPDFAAEVLGGSNQ